MRKRMTIKNFIIYFLLAVLIVTGSGSGLDITQQVLSSCHHTEHKTLTAQSLIPSDEFSEFEIVEKSASVSSITNLRYRRSGFSYRCNLLNSDEPYAKEIAREVIKRNRRKDKIETTTQFKETIEAALSFIPEKERKEAVKKSCQRCFQALRIDVNSEFEVLYNFLDKLPDVLVPGGRVAILTFHSGEDRLVKKAFKAGKKMGIYSEIAEDVIRPSAEECNRNPRARSTKMRWAVRA